MPNFIELVGPSGVGKSTIHNALVEDVESICFLTLEQAFSMTIWPRFLRFSQDCLTHSKPVGWMSRVMVERIFRSDFMSIPNKQVIQLPTYKYLLNHAISTTFTSDRTFELKVQIDKFLRNLVVQHYFVNNNFYSNRPIVMDEGLLMNLRGLGTLDFESIPNIKSVFPKVVINCLAPAELIYDRYIERAAKKGKIISLKSAHDAYIVTNTYSQRILEKIQSCGVAVVDFTCDDLSKEKISDLKLKILKLIHKVC